MKESKAKEILQKILDPSGVQINGNRDWDIRIHNPDFYERVLSGGSLALGESYMDGWWDCEALDQFFERILENRLDKKVKTNTELFLWAMLKAKIINAQNRSKAYVVGKRHYDIGNNLFSIMLDKGLNYSCGYWENAKTLDNAQEAKLDLICRKMGLSPGMKVLDIGCGWGGFAKYAAEKYGANIHGITVSREQVKFANKFCQGLDVKIELKDYRELKEKFDRIVSIGMFEHVGYKNYRTFMKVVHRCLKADGLFLLHTIAGNTSVHSTDPWINKYIFPNSMLPSAKQITSAAEGLFVIEDWHSFGQYYDKTLMAWHNNITKNWTKLKDTYDERFYRMWTYYFLSCAGSFRSRRNQLWQIVFSKKGIKGGYRYRSRGDRGQQAVDN
ncbi:cyclopropane-fatty-acyl-phospholipid synthase [bacterium BMS3Abin07]|nr:cyclopropane-fatty-acyl-phospholipid synthase [bacterium BMS3Abin07]GBE32886.1 cyclopropane-fatty-acyl-phospholipid synthase [bacterium BMS3Bbin05]HDO21488.1 cyclopropane fatty acyl phospholipid synthase [Nitrospirota bacterium]HDZ87011.1 cyclopropane fatty acyl phospholipid synthase [Nitrospirota bacterium]